MNRTIVRALLEDAFQQVLDNRIFRSLLLVVLGFIAPTFLIGFRENDIQILWGWQEIAYEDLFSWFARSSKSFEDVQGAAIQAYQGFVVEGLCGTVGMMFCIAATAFFVPRMLEKGSADVVFSKPVSRTTLLLARYISGILFVAILSGGLVVGMYLGFLIVSGYGDTGFLWGALTLVYLFAIVHSVTLLAGVVTRSTVASTLIALVFFMGTGCVHNGWRISSYLREAEITKKLRQEFESNKDSDLAVPPVLQEEPGTFWKIAFATIDTLHYSLPKTSDADVITRKLRKAIARSVVPVVDDTVHLTIPAPPVGFELHSGGLRSGSGDKIVANLAETPVVWICPGTGGVEAARIEVTRRSRLIERPAEPGAGAKPRPKKQTLSAAADEVLARALGDPASAASEPTSRKGKVDGSSAVFLTWKEAREGAPRDRQAVVFAAGDWIVEARASADPSWLTPEERTARFEDFVGQFTIARELQYENPDLWYERQFGWTAPLKFNVFFSLGSSLVFSVLALVLAAWRLARIEF